MRTDFKVPRVMSRLIVSLDTERDSALSATVISFFSIALSFSSFWGGTPKIGPKKKKPRAYSLWEPADRGLDACAWKFRKRGRVLPSAKLLLAS